MAVTTYIYRTHEHISPMKERSINSFDTLVERFSAQYTTSRSHRMTSAALVSLQQADDESLRNFMNTFGGTTV
ncbi:hypothetical protein JHK85_001725 [Glycine max]|nr:hypothetical protein JHK85_001725 [Glycine max]KAG5089073.1 hypothetical protein JHK86_001685 [Glycine max]